MSRRLVLALAAALLAAYASLGVGFALHASPTWDEVPTFAQGLYLLREARWDIPGSINHPPLSWYLQALPLLLVDLDEGNVWRARQPPEDPQMRFLWRGVYDPARGQALLAANSLRFPDDRLTFLTRMPTLALGLLTGTLLFAWSRRLHGDAGGLVTLALFALSPNTIAHGALATTDMAMMLFTVASAFALWRAFERFGAGRALAAGALLGLACLSKYTALLLVAPFAALVALGALRGEGPRREDGEEPGHSRLWRRAALLLLFVLVAAALTIALGYQGRVGSFLDGVEYQRVNVKHGQIGFLFGEKRMNGWWYYYPAVMALKTPLGALALAGIGALLWLRRERVSTRLLFASFPFLFLLAFFLLKRLPVGLRHVLPVYPALLIAAGAVAAGRWSRPWLQKALVGGLLLWVGAATLGVHPHHLSYVNEAFGGTEQGWRHLADSNFDWGQDLADLDPWMRARGLGSIPLGYFGTADPASYGIHYQALPSFLLRPGGGEPVWPPRGLIAVSTSCYWGLPWEGENPYAFLHGLEPVDRVGASILVFDVP